MKRVVAWVTVTTFLAATIAMAEAEPTAPVAQTDCAPAGQYGFVCGMRNPEDLVLIPGTRWIIASGMAPDGAIYLIDTASKAWTALYPAEARRIQHDTRRFGACPGAPTRGAFVSHGLSLQPGREGRSTLYVVGHGGREAIEVFGVDASGAVPVLTWQGCVLTPDGMEANSVASMADGSLLVTIPLHTGVPISAALAGRNTGGVYRWSPARPASRSCRERNCLTRTVSRCRLTDGSFSLPRRVC